MDGNPDLRTEASAARQLVEAMQGAGFDADDITIGIEGETNFAEAVSAAVRRLAELETLEAGAKALSEQYRERAGALRSKHEALRDALADAIERSGVPLPLRLPEGTVTLQTTAPSAVVVDEDLVPDIYRRTKVTHSIDLRSLALDLREGKAVEGAMLRNARRTLQVRRAG